MRYEECKFSFYIKQRRIGLGIARNSGDKDLITTQQYICMRAVSKNDKNLKQWKILGREIPDVHFAFHGHMKCISISPFPAKALITNAGGQLISNS